MREDRYFSSPWIVKMQNEVRQFLGRRCHDYVISQNLSVVLSGAAGKPDTFINDSWSRSPGRSPYLSPSNPRQPASAVSQPLPCPGMSPRPAAPRGITRPRREGMGHVWPSQTCPFSSAYFIYSLSGDGVWSD